MRSRYPDQIDKLVAAWTSQAELIDAVRKIQQAIGTSSGGDGLLKFPMGATVIIAAANSKNKAGAHYVCDGTDDQEEINDAIQSLPDSGGTVLLLEGDYFISAPIVINKTGVAIVGQGWATRIAITAGADCDGIQIDSSAGDIRLPVIAWLYLYGNKTNNTAGSGIHTFGANQVYDLLVFHVQVFNFAEHAAFFERGHAFRIIDCDFESCDQHGVYINNVTDPSLQPTSFSFFGDHMGGNAKSGVWMQGHQHEFVCCYMVNNGENGVYIDDATRYNRLVNCFIDSNGTNGVYTYGQGNQIIGCVISNNQARGIRVQGAANIVIIGNIIRNNSQEDDSLYDGIELVTSTTDTKIIGNIIESTTANRHNDGISMESTVDNTVIYGNSISGYAVNAIRNLSATSVIADNVGYRTKNGGTATFSGDGSATTFTIAHGLAATPSKVSVTPGSADARGDFHVTVDATNITVTYATAPPSGTDNVVLHWYAEV